MKKLKQGFTLIEILVVLTIMMALMAVIAAKVSDYFRGNEIDKAKRIVENAFAKARSKAVTLEQHVAVYISFRSSEASSEMLPAKLWVVVGAGTDQDDDSSPLSGYDLDEYDSENILILNLVIWNVGI